MTVRNGGPAAAGGHRDLGDGLIVTRLGYGAMQLPGPGIWGVPQDPAEAAAVLRGAVQLGVTHIDTSDAYGPHVANDLIRAALFPYPADLLVATKVGVVRDDRRAFVPAATPQLLREQVLENLRRLRRDRLDLVYLRVGGDGLLAPDHTPLAESFRALADLRDHGLIRHLGLSGVTPAQLDEARAVAPVAAVQNRYHLFDRSNATVLAACEVHNIAFVPYFPLAAGMLRPDLDTSQLPPGMGLTEEQARTLDQVAGRHGTSSAPIAIAWLLHHSPVILSIPGTRSVAHLKENVAAARIRLTDEDMAALDKLADGHVGYR